MFVIRKNEWLNAIRFNFLINGELNMIFLRSRVGGYSLDINIGKRLGSILNIVVGKRFMLAISFY